MGLRDCIPSPLGYAIIRVQVEGVKGYDKDQVAFVVPDSTAFRSRVPVILGTPTINQIMNVIKESERDELSVSLNGSRISILLARCQVELTIKNNTTAKPIPDPTDLNEAVKTTKMRRNRSSFISDCAWSHKDHVVG